MQVFVAYGVCVDVNWNLHAERVYIDCSTNWLVSPEVTVLAPASLRSSSQSSFALSLCFWLQTEIEFPIPSPQFFKSFQLNHNFCSPLAWQGPRQCHNNAPSEPGFTRVTHLTVAAASVAWQSPSQVKEIDCRKQHFQLRLHWSPWQHWNLQPPFSSSFGRSSLQAL